MNIIYILNYLPTNNYRRRRNGRFSYVGAKRFEGKQFSQSILIGKYNNSMKIEITLEMQMR